MTRHLSTLAAALAQLGICTLASPRIMNKAGAAPQLQTEHWYSIRAVGEAEQKIIEVYLYGEIGYWGMTASDFIRDLKAQDDGTSPVRVMIDSVGGDLFDGIAIHNMLQALGERCTVHIVGACFSAASVAACGAHRVEMADNALFMVHNPWTVAAGDSDELRKVAEMMDKAFESIVASYNRRALTVDDAELRRMINAETWLTPPEALAIGFVDAVTPADQAKASNCAHGKILNRYRNTPQAAHDLLASAEPEPEDDPDSDQPDAATLATELAAACAEQGISNLVGALIKASGLKSREAIQAQVARAKTIRELCNLAKLPGEAEQLIIDGVEPEAAKAKLYDKVVATSGQIKITNHPPVDDTPPAASSKAADPGAIYASRKSRASKGAHQ
ncbi:MAG TPA: Clp protease ClpP [Pseudomonas sp.]|uniref:head maturation protease, ClpP-related n=1 Tax=Stutzerimonas balearica TaxID=74829 RepID=UPI000C6583EB|nr:Clp protease ClpP [Phycisphaerae bacterium]HAF94039.1 Clp protease ClpP [Pseudomonas sp.]